MKRLVLVALAACNPVFGLEPTVLQDSQTDQDGDGFDDAVDNCPAIPNPTQGDDDRDRVGNACDNCPLVANADQAVFEDAPVGVACDPHPGSAGDCLVLYDSFDQPDAFATNWTQLPSLAPATITPSEGSVLVHPISSTDAVVLVVTDAAGPMLDRLFDVEVTGHATITTGQLSAMSNASDYRSGYACGIASSASGGIGSDDGMTGSTYQFPLSSPHVSPSLLVRLTPPDALNPQIDCRLSYGVAVGLFTYPPFSPPTGGRPGVRVVTDDAVLDGFALYYFQPGVPCSPPIIR